MNQNPDLTSQQSNTSEPNNEKIVIRCGRPSVDQQNRISMLQKRYDEMQREFENRAAANWTGEMYAKYYQELDSVKYQLDREIKASAFHISYNESGRWTACVPDETNPKKRRKKIRKTHREDLIDALCEYTDKYAETIAFVKELETAVTINDVWRMCIDDMTADPSIKKQTIDRYQNDFDKYFGSIGEYDAVHMGAKDWARHLDDIATRYEMSNSAFRNAKIVLSKIIKKLNMNYIEDGHEISMELINSCCPVNVRNLKHHDVAPEKNIYLPDELQKLFEYLLSNIEGLYHRIILLIMITGIRVGEAVALRSCDLEHDKIHIRKQEEHWKDPVTNKKMYGVTDAPKSDAGCRDVPVPAGWEWLIDELKEQANKDSYVAVNQQGGRATGIMVGSRLKRICQTIGIPSKGLHRIRKTYVTLMANHVAEETLSRIVGHSCVSTTKKFYDFSETNLQDARNQVSQSGVFNFNK